MADILKKNTPKTGETTLDERRQRLKKSQEAILNKRTPFVIQEAYRTARTNIIFSLADSGDDCKIVCITSANAGEGKTTTTLNLAITFAQTGSKVLLIDALINQEINDEFNYKDNDVEYTFNPSNIKSIVDNDSYLVCLSKLNDIYM